MKIIFFILLFSAIVIQSFSQKISPDSSKPDYKKLYAYCLDGDITGALQILDTYNREQFTAADINFMNRFEERFRYTEDKSDFLEKRSSGITDLLKIYRQYWRRSLLNRSVSYDSALVRDVANYLQQHYRPASNLGANADSINLYLVGFIRSKNLHTTGFGKTGRLYDLLVWETGKDTTYSFAVLKEQVSSRVILMDNFITLGWEEYATLDKYYPGGWSTKEALYCVRKAYDMNSEAFLISYLAHEGRHFTDFKLFPKLSGADLEYRAKLTELGMAKISLYDIITFFIRNANYQSGNGHSVANYCVINDLSKALFKVDFEKDRTRWETVSIEKINKTAYALLKKNTKILKRDADHVETSLNNRVVVTR